MLKGDFFSVSSLEISGSDIKAELLINKDHKIFSGHFPGQPVVPGVCMMQMVKELVEELAGKKTNLYKAHEMKFVALIDPSKNNLISAALKYQEADGKLNVTASFFKEELIHFKFKGQFDILADL